MITLRDDQVEAVNKLQNGNILCGDTGSGKSIVSIAYYYKINGGVIENGQMRKRMFYPCDLVIITTAKKRDTCEWERELMNIWMHSKPEFNTYSNNVIIDSWNNIGKYTKIKGAFFIFDEQRVVGSGAWVKAFYDITKNNKWILLSATPGDKWEDYIPVFVANGFYKNKTEFIREHLIYDHHVTFPKVIRYLSEKRLERLRNMILVDIAYSPGTTQHHETIIVDYDRDMYKSVIRNRTSPYKRIKLMGRIVDKPIENASEFCAVLRKITNHSSTEERMKMVDTILEKFDRVIIFYNFDFELEELKKHDWKDREVAECNGHKHDQCPTSDKWVYLLQYNAGNEAWNCITTNCMIFYSENYSYRIMKQASGRIDRSNSPYTDLYYFHIRTMSSIDVQINRALVNKKKFNAATFYKRVVNNNTVRKAA